MHARYTCIGKKHIISLAQTSCQTCGIKTVKWFFTLILLVTTTYKTEQENRNYPRAKSINAICVVKYVLNVII